MKMRRSLVALALGLALVIFVSASANAALTTTGTRDLPSTNRPAALDPSMPTSPVRLVFIHHSSGQNWLNDALRAQLNANNYFVVESDYGWGPDSPELGAKIGDHTDIGHWYNWFNGPNRGTYLTALYSNDITEQTNSIADPGSPNNIVMFKSCFPNSNLGGSPNDPPTTGDNPLRGQPAGSEYMTVGNAKGIYNDILAYFATRQDKLFVVITAPPLRSGGLGANARAFNNWLVNDWLKNYAYHNVAVFDFYNVLTSNGGNWYTNDLNDTSTGNHHRYRNGDIEHVINTNNNYTAYPNGGSDDHPSAAGNRKAASEFLPLLNIYYHCWQSGSCPSAITLTPRAFLPLLGR